MLESFHQRQKDVISSLKDLSAFAQKLGAASLSGRIEADLVQKLEADRFHLVVVGEFNHGKSTFVNALLGRHVLPVGVTPTTAVIHHLVYGDEPSARVVYASGTKTDIAFDQVKSFVVGADSKESKEGNAGEVQYLEVRYPALLLKERIVLVDTPGVNDLSLQRADITYSYIPRSDAVLFLVDAGQPLKESERVFLQEKLLGQSRDKIIFVVTKRDIWNEDEQKEALDYIRTELAKLIKQPVVFSVSAEQALEGRESASGMPELLSHLTKFLAEERGRIQLDNALGEGLSAAVLLKKGVDARRRALQMSTDELNRRIEMIEKDLAGQSKTIDERRIGIREETAAVRAWVRRDLDRFVDDVCNQLPALIDQASADELKVFLGAFLERTFSEWAQAETKEIAEALEALAEKTIALVREDAHDVAKRVSEALGADVRAPDVEVDTFGYDVGVVTLFTIGLGVMFTNALLGVLLTVAAPVLAVYVKEKVEVEMKKKAKELAPAAVREAAGRIGPKLNEMIEDFAKRLDAWVVTAGEELHREVIEVLKAARQEREAALPGAQDAAAACEAEGAALEALVGKLEGQRGALWGGALPGAAQG